MALSASLNQGYSSGGSVNSAWNQSGSQSVSNSWTDAMSARQWSAYQAELAWQRDMEAYQMQMDFNAEEAQKQRDWQTEMANTIYTRSAKNMKEAGINPILAANMGLSGAGVGSGATAAIGGAPSAPLAQSFMDSWSASSANSWGMGESHGNSWNESENGLVTALTAMGNLIGNALEHVTSGANINVTYEGIKDILKDQDKYNSDATEYGYKKGQEIGNKIIEKGGILGQLVQVARNVVEDVTGIFKK